MKKNKVLFTLEEEALLNGLGKYNSGKATATFYFHAFYVCLIPLWLQTRIHQLELMSSLIFVVVLTFFQTFMLQVAYKNVKFVKKDQFATQRTQAITKEIQGIFGAKINKEEFADRILWKKNEVAESESTSFAVFFVNAMYLTSWLIFSFFLLKGNTAFTNYVFSAILSIGIVTLFSAKNS